MKNLIPKIIRIILSVTLIFALTACSSDDVQVTPSGSHQVPDTVTSNQAEETEEKSETFITVIDQAGREIVLEQPIERIVSGYYISSSACIALGLTDKLVGIEAKAESRPIYTMAAPELLKLPDVGTAKEFNMEGCIAMQPDLVILPMRLKDSADILTELGVPVILVNPENHQELVNMINLIGESTDTQVRSTKLISYYDDELEAISELIKITDDKPVVYMGGNSNYLSTAPKDMYQASLIQSAGGINAAEDVDGDNWVDISYEQLIDMNPDIIVIPAEASYKKDDIINDTQLSNITAVREGKIYEMPKDFEAWDSPVPSATLGIRWLLCVLHDNVYSLEMLRTNAEKFYMEFYGTKIDVELIDK